MEPHRSETDPSAPDATARWWQGLPLPCPHERRRILQHALEASGGGLWIIPLERGRVSDEVPEGVFLSPRLRRMLGYGDDELGDSWSAWRALIHPDDQPGVEASLRACLREETPSFEAEYRIGHRDGSLRWVRARGRLAWDADRHGGWLVGLIWDVTADKMAAEMMTESERRFRAICENTYDWETWVDEHGRIIWINGAVNRITGYTVEECLQNPEFPADLVEPADRELIRRIFSAVEDRSEHNDVEFRFRRKDGLYRWGAASWVAAYAEDGAFVGRRVSVREITSRKQIEVRRRGIERRYRKLLETAHLVAVELDQAGKIVYANPFLLKLTGYAESDVLGEDWFETFLPPENRPEVGSVFQDVLTRGLHPYYENEIVTRMGDRCTLAWSNIVLTSPDGEPRGALSLGVDLSAQKQAARELRARIEELELINQLAVGRELRMIELKREVNQLREERGEGPRYNLGEQEA